MGCPAECLTDRGKAGSTVVRDEDRIGFHSGYREPDQEGCAARLARGSAKRAKDHRAFRSVAFREGVDRRRTS